MSGAPRDRRRRAVVAGLGAAGLAGCQPLVQAAGRPPPGFAGPGLEPAALVARDGARLPLLTWRPQGAPWAAFVALHGMNDYAGAFTLPGAYWASRGVAVYAYDQRGFGRAPGRGVWAGDVAMADDLRVAAALVRARHPGLPLAVVGESMGGAVAIAAFASDDPPDADRVVLASPAVWGWRDQGAPASVALWTVAHLAPAYRLTAPDWLARRIRASDNVAELIRMSRDPEMIFATRTDTIYGLVKLMQIAQLEVGRVRAPLFYQYGAHDEIIPRSAAVRAARKLRAPDRSAYYDRGWHLLLRDLGRRRVLDDVLAFVRDPAGPLPSGAPVVPRAHTPPNGAPAPTALASG